MAWCSGFLPCIPEEWRAPVEPLESLAGWMPALAPIGADGNSSWGPMDQLQVAGAGNPGNALPHCALLSLCSDCRGVGLLWSGQLHSHSGTLLGYKKPAGQLQMVFTLILLCSTKEVGQVREYGLQILAPRVILSIDTFTCWTLICPEILWKITFSSHMNVLLVDPLCFFVFGFLTAMAKKLLFWAFNLAHCLAKS